MAQHGLGPSAQALFPPQACGMLCKPVSWPSASSCGTGRTSRPLCCRCLQTPCAGGCSPFAARGQQPISAAHGSGAASSGWCSPSGTPTPLFRRALPSFTSRPSTSAKPFCIYGSACRASAWMLFAAPACCVVFPAWPSQQTRATAAGARERTEAPLVI